MYKQYLHQLGIDDENEGYVELITGKETMLYNPRSDGIEESEQMGYTQEEDLDDMEQPFMDDEEEVEGNASDLVSLLKYMNVRDESIEDLEDFDEEEVEFEDNIEEGDEELEEEPQIEEDEEYIEFNTEEDEEETYDELEELSERRLLWEKSQGFEYDDEEDEEAIQFDTSTEDEEFDVMTEGLDITIEDEEDIFYDSDEEEGLNEGSLDDEECIFEEDEEGCVFDEEDCVFDEELDGEDDEECVFDEEMEGEDDEECVFENDFGEDEEDCVFDEDLEEDNEECIFNEEEDYLDDDEDCVFDEEDVDEDEIVFKEPDYDVSKVGTLGTKSTTQSTKDATEEMMKEFDMVMATNLEKYTLKSLRKVREITGKVKNKLLEGVEDDD